MNTMKNATSSTPPGMASPSPTSVPSPPSYPRPMPLAVGGESDIGISTDLPNHLGITEPTTRLASVIGAGSTLPHTDNLVNPTDGIPSTLKKMMAIDPPSIANSDSQQPCADQLGVAELPARMTTLCVPTSDDPPVEVSTPPPGDPDDGYTDPNVDWRRLDELLKLNEEDVSHPPDGNTNTAPSKKLDTLRNMFKADRTTDVNFDDVIIVVMGPTGAGKSSFISIATSTDTNDGGLVKVGHGLMSCTRKVDMYRLSSPLLVDRDIVLVDTPGFSDTTMSDAETLKLVSDWLKERYTAKTPLAGLLYFHRISDNAMRGTPLKNLRMFEKLCGDEGLGKVILVTTMWDMLRSEKIGEVRERELKNQFWHNMISLGSKVRRFKRDLQSALDILQVITDPIRDMQQTEMKALIQESANLAAANSQTPRPAPSRRRLAWFRNSGRGSTAPEFDTPRPASPLPNGSTVALRLQTELVEEGMQLKETGAGRALFNKLEDLLARRERVLERLRSEIKLSGEEGVPPVALAAFIEDLAELQREFDEANGALSELRLKGTERLIGALNRMRPSRSLFQFFRRLMPSHSRSIAS